ncbi:hypothetical protein BCR42DRAFT_427307 [Absidia repens]|uniref:Uncharacterized protein n=1 Tax=Absidia repens TaxID=90262 RepID=A0A1X2HZS8_9FUNG|nr:hypothetical protein BCR42DRAFT_427307 [Absidia repens]
MTNSRTGNCFERCARRNTATIFLFIYSFSLYLPLINTLEKLLPTYDSHQPRNERSMLMMANPTMMSMMISAAGNI